MSIELHYVTTSFSLAEIFAFSAKERDVETGLSYFGSRYYSSDLSIWLSVDPMSDKYPSLSPYVYCADNPVKLVDPNGETWETTEDADYAKSLIDKAKIQQQKYAPNSRSYKLLQEGIDGLTKMGADENQKYGFRQSDYKNDKGVTCGSVKKIDNVIYMQYIGEQKDASSWHEAVHVTRYNIWKSNGSNKQSKITFDFDSSGYLRYNGSGGEEFHVLNSSWLFDKNSLKFNRVGEVPSPVNDFQDLKMYYDTQTRYPKFDFNMNGEFDHWLIGE